MADGVCGCYKLLAVCKNSDIEMTFLPLHRTLIYSTRQMISCRIFAILIMQRLGYYQYSRTSFFLKMTFVSCKFMLIGIMQAVVTSHLVVRGCYRSITLVVYGNTAEDLGQCNIDFDLDNSLASLVFSPLDGKLEDLPPALLSDKSTIEELVSSTLSLSLPFSDLDMSSEMRHFLHLALKLCQLSDDEAIILKTVRAVVSTLHSHVNHNYSGTVACGDELSLRKAIYEKEEQQKVLSVISEATNELLELYKFLQDSKQIESLLLDIVEEPDSVTSQLVVDMLYQQFSFLQKFSSLDIPLFYQVTLDLFFSLIDFMYD